MTVVRHVIHFQKFLEFLYELQVGAQRKELLTKVKFKNSTLKTFMYPILKVKSNDFRNLGCSSLPVCVLSISKVEPMEYDEGNSRVSLGNP